MKISGKFPTPKRPYVPQSHKGSHKKKGKKQSRREKRQKRKENKASKKTSTKKVTTTQEPLTTEGNSTFIYDYWVLESRAPEFEDFAYETEAETTSTTTSTTTTTTMTTSTVITTVPTEAPKKFGRERTEDLFDMFEGSSFSISPSAKDRFIF